MAVLEIELSSVDEAYVCPGVAGEPVGAWGGRDRLGKRAWEGFGEHGLGPAQRNAVLGARRAGETWLDRRKVELDPFGIGGFGGFVVPEPLMLGVGLHQCAELLGAAGEPQVAQRLGVDGEDRGRRAVLRRHVAYGRPVLERHLRHARAVALDEFADDVMVPKQLGNGEHEVGRRSAFRELAGQAQTYYSRHEHGDRLAEHGRLRLDAPDAPGEHAKAVHHRRVRVGADDGVGIGGALGVGEDDTAQVLEVDLVADADAGRHHAHVREGLLAPAQEPVALGVALVLEGRVHLEGVAAGVDVDDDGMVDNEVDGHERVDPARVATERLDGVSHGGEVDDARHAGEVLEKDARWRVRDLPGGSTGLVTGQGLHVFGLHAHAIFVAQQVLEEELDRIRDPP